MRNITILGATGSIGSQALDVIKKDKEKFNLIAISANNNVKRIIDIIKEHKPKFVTMMDKNAYIEIKDYCDSEKNNITVLEGMDGLIHISTLNEIDIVLTSIVGMIGLKPTIEAIKAKKDIALANKETLVVGGELIMSLAKEQGVKILPVDSEHGAIFQCVQGNRMDSIKKIILTASGGPFRGRKAKELENVTVREALSHPNWSMGQKISIDSATLINKGLEVIEARWLFDRKIDQIETIIHPESIVHSMVEYKDGSTIAQLSMPNMRLPIQYALNYPERRESVIEPLDLFKIGKLTFEKPDMDTFKGLKLSFESLKAGGNACTILNSANEVCVDLFLKNRIKFLDIANIIETCLENVENIKVNNLENILHTEKLVKDYIDNKFK